MRAINASDVLTLLEPRRGPCISIYQPVERQHPVSLQGPVLYKNLLGEVEEALRKKYPGSQVQSVLEKFRALRDDTRVWGDCKGGLAVLGSADEFHVFDLARAVPRLAVVNHCYHLKPLLRIVQSADRFQVLCLEYAGVRLLEGNRDWLREVPANGVPLTPEKVLAGRQPQPDHKVGAHTAGGYTAAGGKGAPGGPGHANRDQVRKEEAQLYFQAVDRAVWEHVSRASGLPLVLAALPQNQSMFRSLSHNQHLVECGIDSDPGALSDDQLRQRAWKCVEPRYLQRLAKFCEDFEVARSRGQGTADVEEASRAAHGGRVGILLVEADRVVPGRVDAATGAVTPGVMGDPDVGDVLDDVAETTLRMKGTVVVVPRERMPTKTGLAAVLRF
jgi:hypothetical protein